MKLPAKCPKYIAKDYPEHAANWPDFVREVEGFKKLLASDLPPVEMWTACANWWSGFLGDRKANESHGRGVSCFYYAPPRWPWAIFGRSASMLQRSVYVSIEASDCDVKTVAELVQD